MSDLMTPTTTQRPSARIPWVTDLTVVAAAVVCSFVAWLCLAQLAGVDLEVRTGDTTRNVGIFAILLTVAIVSVLGIGLLRLLEGTSSRGLTIWTAVAVVVALLSVLGPLGATSAAATGVLLALHAIVATVVIVGARRARGAFGAR